MTTTKKMTKRDYFNILRASFPATAENYDEVIAFIDHELELLAKKNADSSKVKTKLQEQNEELKMQILDWMPETERFTCSALQKSCPACENLSTPKISVLVNQLCASGLLVKTIDKRVSYFSKA